MKPGPFQRLLQPGDIVVQERDGVSSKQNKIQNHTGKKW